MRKKLFFFISVSLVVGTCFFFTPSPHLPSCFNNYCAFCDPVVLNYQKFYEDDLVLALYTYRPIFPGHCLIIPKRGVGRFELLKDEEVIQISRVIKKVNEAAMKVFGTCSYLLFQKNGHESGQSVPHVHFHYLPRKADDASSIQFIIKMYLALAKRPISSAEMGKVVKKLKEAIEDAEVS